jgi:predicted GNAT family N-acyltransferase
MDVVELDDADAEALCDLYADYEWWADRDPKEVRTAIDHSITLAAREGDRLVASARILTDRTYYAKIYDVIVAADRRGDGLGREFMAAVADHEPIADLEPALLCREGLIQFYEDCGFERIQQTTDVAGENEEFVRMRYHR